jgi:hypothetical protein
MARRDLLARDVDYAEAAKQLVRIGRYERRALARRKSGIRALEVDRRPHNYASVEI